MVKRMRFSQASSRDNVLLIDDGGKNQGGRCRDPYEAAGFENAVERGLERFGKLLVLHADRGQFFVGDEHAAHHHDARGDRVSSFSRPESFLRESMASTRRVRVLARALPSVSVKRRCGGFRGFVLFLIVVVFVCMVFPFGGRWAPTKEDRPKSSYFMLAQTQHAVES